MDTRNTPRRSARLNAGQAGSSPGPTTGRARLADLPAVSPKRLKRASESILPRLEQSITAYQALQWLFIVWLAVLLLGVCLHQESAAHISKAEVRRLQKALPLSIYDYVFRKAGAVLWLVPFLLRALSANLAGQLAEKIQHFRSAAAVHIILSMARALLYGVHYYGSMLVHFGSKPEDYFSDHVLLGAALSASLAVEIVFGLRSTRGTSGSSLVALRSAYIVALILYLLTTADVYFTAVYFHPRKEVFLALLLGLGYQAGIAFLLLLPQSLPEVLQPLSLDFNNGDF